MSYSFTPLSDAEIDALNIVPKGMYKFQVLKSARRKSKAGNDMAELQIKYWDIEGREHLCFDYLVFSNVGLNIRKIKHFCDSVGLAEEYKKGCMPEELEGLCGTLSLGIREEQPKPDGGFYPKKNIVEDYVSPSVGSSTSQAPAKKDEFIDDEIPF